MREKREERIEEKLTLTAKLRKERKRRREKGGYSLIEVMLVLALISAVIVGIYFAYTRIKRNFQINEAAKKVNTFISVVEGLGGSLGGYYPSEDSNVDVSTTDPFTYVIGENKNALAGWKYNCPQGDDSTITVTIPSSVFGSRKEAPEVCKAVALQVNKNSAWKASCDTTGKMTLQKEHVICQPATS